MNTTQRDALREQTNAKETDNYPSGEIWERHQVEGTIFQIVGNKEKGYHVAIGKFLLTEPVPEKGIAELKIKNKDWDLIISLMGITAEQVIEEANREETFDEKYERLRKEVDDRLAKLGQDDKEG